MIRFERPVYLCSDCGKKVRGVNVVDGRNLCRDCTILALRKMDENKELNPKQRRR